MEYQGQSEKHLENICEGLNVVLPNCEKWFTNDGLSQVKNNLRLDSQVIVDLSQELGLPPENVLCKI